MSYNAARTGEQRSRNAVFTDLDGEAFLVRACRRGLGFAYLGDLDQYQVFENLQELVL